MIASVSQTISPISQNIDAQPLLHSRLGSSTVSNPDLHITSLTRGQWASRPPHRTPLPRRASSQHLPCRTFLVSPPLTLAAGTFLTSPLSCRLALKAENEYQGWSQLKHSCQAWEWPSEPSCISSELTKTQSNGDAADEAPFPSSLMLSTN